LWRVTAFLIATLAVGNPQDRIDEMSLPEGLNAFMYASANPTRFTDASGMAATMDDDNSGSCRRILQCPSLEGLTSQIPLIAAAGMPSAGALQAAALAATRAAAAAGTFVAGSKHLANSGGRWSKFLPDINIQATVREGLESINATFRPNLNPIHRDETFVVITNLAREIGTKGEQAIKIVVENAGRVVTAYPVRWK